MCLVYAGVVVSLTESAMSRRAHQSSSFWSATYAVLVYTRWVGRWQRQDSVTIKSRAACTRPRLHTMPHAPRKRANAFMRPGSWHCGMVRWNGVGQCCAVQWRGVEKAMQMKDWALAIGARERTSNSTANTCLFQQWPSTF